LFRENAVVSESSSDNVRTDSRLVTSERQLVVLCERWLEDPVLAVDTEFVRTRTFYARLGLIQVCDSQGVSLIDTVAVQELSPFRDVLARRTQDTVLHSCGEDLGIFAHEFGVLPRSVFDTQIAAAFVGLGFSRGYQGLLEEVVGVRLAKDETRSNWMARPLSESQIRYAVADVAYLPDLRQRLLDELRLRDRESWAREEFGRLTNVERYSVDPDDAFRRIKGAGGLDRRGLGVLRDLAAWRERQAIQRDLARNFVLHDNGLLEIARKRPRNRRDLSGIQALRDGERRRYGDTLLEMVERGAEKSSEDLPPRLPRPKRVSKQKELTKALQQLVVRTGAEQGIAPELLARKKVLEELIHRVAAGSERRLPAELEGWRRVVIGEPMLDLLMTA
jgi:ribonuclease D